MLDLLGTRHPLAGQVHARGHLGLLGVQGRFLGARSLPPPLDHLRARPEPVALVQDPLTLAGNLGEARRQREALLRQLFEVRFGILSLALGRSEAALGGEQEAGHGGPHGSVESPPTDAVLGSPTIREPSHAAVLGAVAPAARAGHAEAVLGTADHPPTQEEAIGPGTHRAPHGGVRGRVRGAPLFLGDDGWVGDVEAGVAVAARPERAFPACTADGLVAPPFPLATVGRVDDDLAHGDPAPACLTLWGSDPVGREFEGDPLIGCTLRSSAEHALDDGNLVLVEEDLAFSSGLTVDGTVAVTV